METDLAHRAQKWDNTQARNLPNIICLITRYTQKAVLVSDPRAGLDEVNVFVKGIDQGIYQNDFAELDLTPGRKLVPRTFIFKICSPLCFSSFAMFLEQQTNQTKWAVAVLVE